MIGFFDSGRGGLTILEAVRKQLPQHDFGYLDDSDHAPYGLLSESEIFQHTTVGISRLFQEGSQLVILACNTASSVLRRIQQDWLPEYYPDQRVLGIIVPTIEQIIQEENKNIGILATPATVKSQVYQKEISQRNSTLKIFEQACPNLASLIEHSATSDQLANEISACTQSLLKQAGGQLDDVLLGCTHYEHVSDQIKQHLPETTRLYHQPSIVAQSLVDYLHRHPEIDQKISKNAQTNIL